MQWAEYFRVGGPYVYALTAIGAFGIVFSAFAFLVNIIELGEKTRMVRMTLGGVTLFFVLMSCFTAVIAWFIGSQNLADALQTVSESERAIIQARGEEYLTIPFVVAAIVNCVPALIGVVTFVRGIKTPKP